MQSVDAAGDQKRPGAPLELPSRSRPGIGFDLGSLLILTAGSLLVGGLGNLWRSKPLPWAYVTRAQSMDAALGRLADVPVPPAVTEMSGDLPHEVRLEEFRSFVMEHKGLVLDARPAVFYGEAHVPGALSLPRETFADDYPQLRATLETSKDRPIAIYCSGADCPDSQLLTDALTRLGFRRLLIYTSGWEEWAQAGLPQEGASAQP